MAPHDRGCDDHRPRRHVQTAGGGIVIQRMKTGRLAKSGETPKARYGLLQAMVKRDEGVGASFLHISLLDGSQKSATIAAGKRTEAVADPFG
jgi:DNA helicase-2/ATP-dependent DNA helicase PcrA